MKLNTIFFAALIFVSFACMSFGQGIPPDEWTPKEKQEVDSIRAHFQKQGMPFTDEQAQMAVKNMRETIAGLAGKMSVFQSLAKMSNAEINVQTPAVNSLPPGGNTLTEEQLAASFARLPPKTGDLLINPRHDGFDINGQPYLDSEGQIVNYAYDVVTGDITYMVMTPSRLVIKSMRAGSTSDPITIAAATQSAAGWDVQTVTGKRLGGNNVSALPFGLLVSREYSAFRYEPGKGITNIAVPKGYLIAPLQRGNIGATGYVLLEKENSDGGQNEVGRLFSSIKAIGAIIGISRKEDYALMNMETGKLYPLNINADGKYGSDYSQCCKRKHTPAECRKMAWTENLYDTTGRNTQHYYWLVNWVKTPAGPIAVSLENGHRDVLITDLTTGRKVTAFNRTLGINWFDIEQKGDGRVRIISRAAFQTSEIDDAVAHMKKANEHDKNEESMVQSAGPSE